MPEMDPRRREELERIISAEKKIEAQFESLFKGFTAKAYGSVGRGKRIDPSGVFSAGPLWTKGVEAIVAGPLRELAVESARVEVIVPEAEAAISDYLTGAKNRLVNVPDSVYALIKGQVMTATTEGWSADDLAEKIEEILGEAGAERWHNRSITIARTESIAAYNAGQLAGFVSTAKAEGGQFEKVWLATDDTATRPTHAKADLQRVKLMGQFRVGKARAAFPGDPSLPPEECIRCRCSMLLVEKGEEIDLSDRQFMGGDPWA